MKRVLVTGGAGFLGANLCEKLLEHGNVVYCLDNFQTGSKRNVDDLLGNESFNLIEHDLIDPIDIDVDQIYNLACPASPPHYQFDPVRTFKTSIFGALNVLDLAKKLGVPVLQASTSEVYGDPVQHPQHESYWGNVNPIGPRACYDEGKRGAETLFFDYHRQYGVIIKVIRIFNTYGPRMDIKDGRVVSNVIVQALRGEDITVYGDGLQTRSFCYVDDLVRGIIGMMNSADDVIGPINLGNPIEFTVNELVQTVCRLTSSTSKIVNLSLPVDDPKQRQPDISEAKAKLNWAPEIMLEEGLMKAIRYFQAQIN